VDRVYRPTQRGQIEHDRHVNVLKRLLVQAGACNLGLWMRTLIGVGTPRGLQGRLPAAMAVVVAFWTLLEDGLIAVSARPADQRASFRPSYLVSSADRNTKNASLATGC